MILLDDVVQEFHRNTVRGSRGLEIWGGNAVLVGNAWGSFDHRANSTYARILSLETIRLDPVRRSERELRLIGDRVSRLWNAGNYRCRQAFLVPSGFNRKALVKAMSEDRPLPSDMAQEVLKKLSAAWRSSFALRSPAGREARLVRGGWPDPRLLVVRAGSRVDRERAGEGRHPVGAGWGARLVLALPELRLAVCDAVAAMTAGLP